MRHLLQYHGCLPESVNEDLMHPLSVAALSGFICFCRLLQRGIALKVFRLIILVFALNEALTAAAKDEVNLDKVSPKAYYLDQLVKGVPVVMKSFVEETGRFALAGWIPEYQEAIYPLAYLATTKEPATPYTGDAQLLNAAMKGGDALRDSQYEDGTVEFLKQDGSSWGRIYPHKLLTAWLENYALLKDRLDADRRGRWEKGLNLMVEGTHQQILGKRNPRLFSGIFRNDQGGWGWGNFEVNSLSIWDGLN